MSEPTSTEVVKNAETHLVIRPEQQDWTPVQFQALLDMYGIGNAPVPVVQGYFHICKTTGLDPFKRQIHLIERQGKWTPQTSIDGFRLIRDRSGVFRGMEKFWFGEDGEPKKLYPGSLGTPAGALVILHIKGLDFPVEAVAYWEEYVQTKRDGETTKMWTEKGRHMLMKCAEALAIRSAFPDDTGGLYTEDEMLQASVVNESQAPGNSGGGRQRSPGIMDLEEPPISTPAAQAPSQTVGGGFMDAPAEAPAPAEDPNIEDAVIVEDPAPQPEQPAAAPSAPVAAEPVPEPVPEVPEAKGVDFAKLQAAEEAAGAPMDMAPEAEQAPAHQYLWAAKLAVVVEGKEATFDIYALRVLFDEAVAAGALGETVPWSGMSLDQTVNAIRANLEAGRDALEGVTA